MDLSPDPEKVTSSLTALSHTPPCSRAQLRPSLCVRAEYWVVDTENFGHFEGHELLPNIADVLRIVDGFLETHDAD